MLTTSESKYEHSDEDGNWSSEEMGSENEEVSFLLHYFFFFFTLYVFLPFFIIGRAKTGAAEAESVVNNTNSFSNSSNVHLLCSSHNHPITPLLVITITVILMQPTVRSAVSPLVATLTTPKVRH